MRQGLSLICIFGLYLGGCAEGAAETKLTLPVAAFKTGAAQAQGVGIGIQPITAANIRKFRDLNEQIEWREDASAPAKAGAPAKSTTQIKRDLLLPLLPFPCAKIRIINQSGQSLPLDHFQLALRDAGGKLFPVYADRSKAQERVLSALLQAQPGLHKESVESQVVAAIGKLPYLNVTKEIPSGGTWTGYVSFDMTSVGDVDGYLRSSSGLELFASNLGAVPELRLPLEKITAQVELLCPSGQHDANLYRCHQVVEQAPDPHMGPESSEPDEQ